MRICSLALLSLVAFAAEPLPPKSPALTSPPGSTCRPPERLLPRHPLRLVRRHLSLEYRGTSSSALVRQVRTNHPRRHHRPGRRIPKQRRRSGLQRSQARRDLHPHRSRRRAQARRARLPALRTYDIVDPGKWDVRTAKDRVQFTTLSPPKTALLPLPQDRPPRPAQAVLVIEHS